VIDTIGQKFIKSSTDLIEVQNTNIDALLFENGRNVGQSKGKVIKIAHPRLIHGNDDEKIHSNNSVTDYYTKYYVFTALSISLMMLSDKKPR
jgi:hypothetical protein